MKIMEEELNARQRAARRRVQRELAENPDLYRQKGHVGGSARVPKGVAVLSQEERSARGTAAAKARYHHKEA